jgi:hypothetical protein
MWYDVGAIILYFHSVMDDNTKWIKNKKEENENEGFDPNSDEGFDPNSDEGFDPNSDEGFDPNSDEGFEIEETSSEAIRAIEEKINQARKHFTKLPLFESLQPTQIKEGYSTKNGLIKFDKNEKKKIKETRDKIKKWSDPETWLRSSIPKRSKKKPNKKTTIENIFGTTNTAVIYIRNMCYVILVFIGTYNVYNLKYDTVPQSSPEMTPQSSPSLSFAFIDNLGWLKATFYKIIEIFISSTNGHHRFLISMCISFIAIMSLTNPLGFVILLLDAFQGKPGEAAKQLYKSPLIPFVMITGILVMLYKIQDISSAIDFGSKGVVGTLAAKCLTLVLMVLWLPIECAFFSLSLFYMVFLSGGFKQLTNFKNINNELDIDIKGDTTSLLPDIWKQLKDLLTPEDPSTKIMKQIGSSLSKVFTAIPGFPKLASISKVVPESLQAIASASLPVASASLPVASDGLPVASASLPVASASLPVASASLPVASASSRPDTIYDNITKIICNHIIFFILLIVHIGSLINTKANILFMWIPPTICIPIYLSIKHVDVLEHLFKTFDNYVKNVYDRNNINGFP